MLAHIVAQLFLSALAGVAHALIFSAPQRCGGRHTITHASAFFGPRPGSSQVSDVPLPLFAPRAQAGGNYIRLVHPTYRKIHPSRREHVEAGGIWRCLKKVRLAAMQVARLQGGWREPKGDGERADEGIDSAMDLDVREETVENDVESARETVAVPGDRDTVGVSDIGEHDEAAANDSTPFLLFNACRPLSVPGDIRAMNGRVAVVARGVCDFAQKVFLMQSSGAMGVIVVNREGEKNLANMKLNDSKKISFLVKIPTVMISYDDWLQILPCRNETDVIFTDKGEATFDMDYGREALNWAMMRGMALWILCQCGVNVVRYKRRVTEFRARADAIAALPVDTYTRPQSHRDEAANATDGDTAREDAVLEPTPPLNVTGPSSLPLVHDHDPQRVRLISSNARSTRPVPSLGSTPPSSSTAIEDDDDTEDEEPVCAVCLEDFETGQQVRRLACSHLYHRSCIDPWLQSSSNSCPLCKREVPNLPPPPTQLHYGSMNV